MASATAQVPENANPGRSAAPMEVICLILSAAGGFADAGSFVLIGSFTGHVTGNALLTAVHLVQGRFTGAVLSAAACAAFMTGTATGTVWKHESATPIAVVMKALIVEVALVAAGLVCFKVGGLPARLLLAGSVCFSLGLQNGTLNKLGSVSIHGTYITGMSTVLVAAVFSGKTAESSVLLRVIASFLAGALVGAFLVSRFGEPGFALVLVPLALALGMTVSWQAREIDRPPASPDPTP